MRTRSLRSILSTAAFSAAGLSFTCAMLTASLASAAGNNVGIEVVTPAPSTRYHGLQGNGGYVLSLFINSPRHDAPAGTYPRDAVPLDYKLTFAVCQNRISYARVIGRFDASGAKQSTYLGTNADWRIVHDEEYVAGPRCPAGSQRPQGIPVCHYTFANTKNRMLDLSALPADLCATTLQLVAVQGADRSGNIAHNHPGPTHASFGVTPAMLLDPESNWQKAHKMTHAVNLWLNFACAGSSSSPSSSSVRSSSQQSSSAPSSVASSSQQSSSMPSSSAGSSAVSSSQPSSSAASSSAPASSSVMSSSQPSSSAPSSAPQSSPPSSSSSSVAAGCVEIRTETFDPRGAPVAPVAQFTYALDGTRTAFNDATGYARFDGVIAGTHVVQQLSPGSAWTLESITPVGGSVLVQGGGVCAGVVFKNRQILPALTIAKTDGRVTARAGEILTYTITVTNPSQAPAANATVTDDLPAELRFLSASDGPQVSGPRITWTGLALAPGTSRTFSVQAQVLQAVPGGTAVRNVAQVTGPATAQAEDITRIEGDDDCMEVSIDTDRDPVEPGEELTYTVTVRNTMNHRRETDVFLTLPDEAEFQDASDDGEEDDGTVEWTVELDAGEEIELEATVEVDGDDAEDGDTLEAVASADCGLDEETTEVEEDADEEDDDEEDEDISVLKDASPSEVFPGGTVEYTVTVENNGEETLEDIEVTDRLSGVHFSIIDDGGADSRTGNTLKWEIRELKKGKSKVLRYRIVVDGAAYPGDRVTNVVTARSGDVEDEADAAVTVIGSLPQTGLAARGGKGGSKHLTPYAAAGGGTSAAAAIGAGLSGIGAGLALMRRRMAGL